MRRERQRGVALLTVLLVAALTTVIATAIISDQHLAIVRTRALVEHDQALTHALGAETWVRVLLRRDLREEEAEIPVDAPGDLWDVSEAPFDIDGGTLELRVRDLGGLINLNAIDDAASVDRAKRLLDAVGVDPAIAEAIRDWTDPDDVPSGTGGAEDDFYTGLDPAFRAANAPFGSVTELVVLPGVDETVLDRLLPVVAALPPGFRRVNVNSAPAAVISAVAPGIDPDRAAELAARETPFANPGEIITVDAAFAPESGVLAVASAWFEILVRSAWGDAEVTLRTIVHRDPETGVTRILGRDLARRFERWAEAPADDAAAGPMESR